MHLMTRKRYIVLGAIILLMLVVSGCQPAEDQTEFHVAWESGPHSTYDQGHGPNDWCARCHSPQNWNPEATVGTPPNCVSCKFPGQDMTVGDGNVLIEEADWVAIPCESCHMMEDDIAAEVAWLNPISMEYVAVSNTTELCEKCHVTTTGNAFGSGVDHKITLGGSAHLNYGGFMGEEAPPTYCTDCHDPHTTEPKQCVDCHAEAIETAEHANGSYGEMRDTVTCIACHDAFGYDVGPNPAEDIDLWTTTLTTVGRGGPSTSAVISHSIVHEVACDRCHFEENLWELTVRTAAGEIPPPPTPTPEPED